MAATLLLGTLDLSSYLALAPGEGTDPSAAAYSQRLIGHSVLREGGTFALEDRNVKELTFPLYLNAASTDALTALVQSINLALNEPNQTATWTDEGASQATIFDLATGQLDIAYDFRRAQNHYLHATLRLFAQPFGRAPTRLLGTAVGTGPLLIFSSPSPLRGDVPAPLFATVSSNSIVERRLIALSLLPASNAQYTPEFTASNLAVFPASNAPAATVIGESGAVASMFRRVGVSSQAGQPSWLALGEMDVRTDLLAGRQRLLLIARPRGPSQFLATSTDWATIPVWVSDGVGNANVPVGVPGYVNAGNAPTEWTLFDLGVLTFDPSLRSVQSLKLWTTRNSWASYAIDITGAYLLPEDNTVIINDKPRDPSNQFPSYGWIDPFPTDCYTINGASGQVGRFQLNSTKGIDLTSLTRGIIPAIPPGATGMRLGYFSFAGLCNDAMRMSVSVTERTRFVF